MSKYQGRRMVKNDLIAQIGQGEEYTAGTGIDITSDTISVDSATVAMKSDLATVATSGDYTDLLNTPTIPAAQVQSDWSQSDNTQVDYIKNKPTIPAAVSGTNDGTNWTNLTIGNDTYGIGGGSTPTNMVTTNTNQTISGRKDFDNIRNVNFVADGNQLVFGYNPETGNSTQEPTLNFKIFDQYAGSKNKITKFSFQSSNPNSGGGSSPSFTERAHLDVYGNGSIQLRNDGSGATSDASIVIMNKAGNGLSFFDSVTRFNTISGHLLVVPDEEGTLITSNKVPDVDTTTDGTYVLKATVSSGVVTYTWVLE